MIARCSDKCLSGCMHSSIGMETMSKLVLNHIKPSMKRLIENYPRYFAVTFKSLRVSFNLL